MQRSFATADGVARAHSVRAAMSSSQSLIRLIKGMFVATGVVYLALFAYFSAGASILEPYSDMLDIVFLPALFQVANALPRTSSTRYEVTSYAHSGFMSVTEMPISWAAATA